MHLKVISPQELLDVRLRLEGIASVKWEESIVKTQNWNAKWEADYEPVDVEGRAMVRAPFHSPPKSGLDIVIAPHMSFGTGHHSTTWLMTRAMLDLDLDDKDVLDMGCGTGVLALAAMKLGASKVLAIDIEEGAYRNTLENAKLNDLDGDNRLNAVCGDASKLGSSPTHDLILSNINRNILLADMATYDSVLKVGGKIALSGFFIGDVPVISEETERLGWSVVEVLESDGWACIICVKTPK